MNKICLVTSTRADYGIMSNLIRMLSLDNDISLRLCVTGTHLSKKYGYTRDYIDLDASFIDEIDILSDKGDVNEVCEKTIANFSKYFNEHSFDLVILLGDRFEMFYIASVAYMNKTKIAHIHGGETTYGALDEEFRHCITKLSNLHFASCEKYKNRIIQMGEMPDNVYNVGSLSVENIMSMECKSLDELRKEYNFSLNKYAMVTFNPVTIKEDNGLTELKELIDALTLFDYELIVVYPNMDSGNEKIIELITNIKCKEVHVVKSFPYSDFISLAKNCSLFIGNSSSGIIEIPSLNVPIIDIGDRQKGREASEKVVHCEAECKSITNAINYVRSKEYLDKYLKMENIYYKKDTAETIIRKIKDYLEKKEFDKYFYNIY